MATSVKLQNFVILNDPQEYNEPKIKEIKLDIFG